MMKKLLYIIPFLLLVLLLSCNDDENFKIKDTKVAEIGPYFPAYAGSWWKYSNGETMRVADEYVQIKYAESENMSEERFPVLENCGLLTSVSGDPEVYVNKYAIFNNRAWNPKQVNRASILSTEEGKEFYCQWMAGTIVYGYTFKTDTSITINGKTYNDVIVTAYYSDWSTMYYGSDERDNNRQYFAKNIGFIKEEYKSNIDSLWYESYVLEDYHLGN